MKYLAIDTAGDPAAILVKNGEKTFFRTVTEQKRTSEVLLPSVDEMLDESGLTLDDLDFMAVVTGPGSFTGIRIGVNTVKTFAYVKNTPIAVVDSLKKLTFNDIPDCAKNVICAVHAYANFCYIAVYDADGIEIAAPQTLDYVAAREFITAHENAVTFADKAACNGLKIECLTDNAEVSLARAAEAFYDNGKTVDYGEVEPFYLMKSQAERELENKEKRG